MKNYFVKKSSLKGELYIPSSKSQSMRAILFASLAKGKSKIKNFLKSDDIFVFIEGCRKFKAKIEIKKNNLEIEGVNSKIVLKKNDSLDVKNSGIALRFLTAVYAIADKKIIITGDSSICRNRPMQPLIHALNFLNADIKSLKKEGFAPIEINGPITNGKVKIEGADSQYVSALLIAASLLKEDTYIEVENPGEKPWVDLTLNWLDKFNVKYINENFEKYKVSGGNKFKAFEYAVPSDFSSILFPIVAALITNSEITIKDIVFDDLQKDQKTIDVFKKFNAEIEVNKNDNSIIVKKSTLFGSAEIDINDFVDSLPILAVFACFNDGKIILKNASVCKNKESNRIAVISSELKKMNAKIEVLDDGLVIEKSNLKPATVNSYNDHRIAMSLCVAALAIDGITTIEDISCIDKTYPGFKEDFIKMGACIL
ncbi:MAG: 3-phosphoshikimate 1-carboxyvinyltransferase [Parachlamydiales bacterium]|jgi:3-phosphoshikimate 1-carboxyvinyltransferase